MLHEYILAYEWSFVLLHTHGLHPKIKIHMEGTNSHAYAGQVALNDF